MRGKKRKNHLTFYWFLNLIENYHYVNALLHTRIALRKEFRREAGQRASVRMDSLNHRRISSIRRGQATSSGAFMNTTSSASSSLKLQSTLFRDLLRKSHILLNPLEFHQGHHFMASVCESQHLPRPALYWDSKSNKSISKSITF